MNEAIRRKIAIDGDPAVRAELLRREWLATNGLGGYASGTLARGISRRYHGLLVAALPAPLGRVVMLSELAETVVLPDDRRAQQLPGPAGDYLRDFTLEYRLPVWRYEIGGAVLIKRLVVVHGQNTVQITYTLESSRGPVRLEIAPWLQFRRLEDDVTQPLAAYSVSSRDGRHEITAAGSEFSPLRLSVRGPSVGPPLGVENRDVFYAMEAERGYASRGPLWGPGRFTCELQAGNEVHFIASTETWEVMEAIPPATAWELEGERCRQLLRVARAEADPVRGDLILAADQFLISPVGRIEDGARARAVGDELRTVIAGYHWFTDWGRDTMISLEGLTLATGREVEAEWILRTFAHSIRDGLIPNLFPEGTTAGLYHTADATLWFFHALDRYTETTGDRRLLHDILPRIREIIRCHIQGTLFHIGMDPADALLRQGEVGYQLTWMDAKVGDWVVTPRRGKAVEINALWYNALKLAAGWLKDGGEEQEAQALEELAARARASFNARFWMAAEGYLYDVIDGDKGNDPACRPNQIFSMTLRHPVLDESRWRSMLAVVQDQLLTPYGLRSLSPRDPDYKPHYFGDLRARDAAYHQGTVWAWLIGPYIDAWLRVNPAGHAEIPGLLQKLVDHLGAAGVGSISEVFDAEAPYTPRGCIAQAWSVAEVLRCWLRAKDR